MGFGRILGGLEEAFGIVWSIGEVGLAAARRDALGPDPAREAVLRDVRARGFYVPFESEAIDLSITPDGRIEGRNPYERIATRADDRILAHLRRSPGARHLVVVCHCYGVPSPQAMATLFGLDSLGVDVCTNIMGHHQPGTYSAWPGSGFVRVRVSDFLENLRASVTGARALVTWLRARHDYESVTVIGFSIGGQLALHLANAAPVDQVIAYCPVTRLHVTMKELGLMRYVHRTVERTMRRFDPGFAVDHLAVADPLAHELRIDPSDLHVVVQRHDRLATPEQIEAIRERHPRARFYDFGGTHLYPASLGEVQTLVRDVVRSRTGEPSRRVGSSW